jgi:predicted RNA-binding Zn ribbon-like protein
MYNGYEMASVHDLLPEPTDEEELFVAFANTLEFSKGEPQETLPDIEALLDWLAARGLLSSRARSAERARLRRDPQEAERRVERFRHLRSLLHDVAGEATHEGHPTAAQVQELNHILRHGLHYHQLVNAEGGSRYTVAQVGDRLDQARATIAGSFAHFLADEEASRLRVCANEGCRWVFVDRSPTGRRRWCDMRTCGNQAKVARHRARAKAKDSGVPATAGGG